MTADRPSLAYFTDKGVAIRGVVHVGIHEGQEIPWYLEQGLAVLCFEPQWQPYTQLAGRFLRDICAGVIDVQQVGLSDYSGWALLCVPQHLDIPIPDEQSASFLRPDYNSPYEWGERGNVSRYTGTEVQRFDAWAAAAAAEGGWPDSSYNALVIDVQGYELQVLRGFGNELARFDYLCVECSETPIYLGGASAQEVCAFLAEHGFKRDSPIQVHGDVFFARAEPA